LKTITRTTHSDTETCSAPYGDGADTDAKSNDQGTTPFRLSEFIGDLTQLSRDLCTFAPYRTTKTLLLMGITAGLEMFGLVLIIPFLYLVTSITPPQELSTISKLVLSTTDTLQIELTLTLVLGLFLGLITLRALGVWQRDMHINKISLDFVQHCLSKVGTAIVMARWQSLVNSQQSEMQLIMNERLTIKNCTVILLNTMVRMMLISGKLLLVILISPLALLFILPISALPFLLKKWLLKLPNTLSRRHVSISKKQTRVIRHFISSLKLVKSSSLEEQHIRQYVNTINDLQRNEIETVSHSQ